MDKETVAQMISQDRTEWSLLTAVLDAHPDEILHESQAPPWTSRDVYAHLARWLVQSNKDMEAYCAGRGVSPPVGDADEVNSRRLAIIASIPIDRWDKELERIAHYDGAEHLAAHRRYISVT